MVLLHFIHTFARCGTRYLVFCAEKSFHFACSVFEPVFFDNLGPNFKMTAFTSLLKAVIGSIALGSMG